MKVFNNRNIIKAKRKFFLYLARILPVGGYYRSKIVRQGGVNIEDCCWIGRNVTIDNVAPELITIKRNAVIAEGTMILTHYFVPHKSNLHQRKFEKGKIVIGEGVFIGCNTIICKPVAIGKGSVVGAGSVVTKDIPDYQVWAGNPAKFIKKRKTENRVFK